MQSFVPTWLQRAALLAWLAPCCVGVANAQGLPAGTELVVADTTEGPPGARDAVTIAVDLDAAPLANTTPVGTGALTDTPGHLVVTPSGDIVLADLDADPSGLGPDPSGGPGRGGTFIQAARDRDLLLHADGTRCSPVLPGCGTSGVFVDPRGIAWSEALGAAFVVDPEADPSLLGSDRLGGAGHGAVFLVDAGGAVSLVADGTIVAPGFPGPIPAFDEPVAAALAADGTLFVVDAAADPLGLGWRGALFAVDVATGRVSIASVDPGFADLRDVAVEPAGTLLLLDGLAGGNGQVLRVDLDPPPNVVSRVASALFADPRAIAVAPGGIAYVVDAAADPMGTGAGGAVLRVDVDASDVSVASATGDFRDPTGIDVVVIPPPGGCGTAPADSLRMQHDGCGVVLTWDAPPAECSETFRIWRGTQVAPSSGIPDFPHDPPFEDVTSLDADSDATNGWAGLPGCGDALEVYLVGRIDPDGTESPVGAYGR